MKAPAHITAEELPYLQPPNKRTELVRGVMRVSEPASARHGLVAAKVLAALAASVQAHRLGAVFAAETGFTLERGPDTVRAPDAAFVSRVRLPDPLPTGFPEMAPDLAVEVLSPGDRPGEVLGKVGDWLRAGCRVVWVIDPERRQVRVYRTDGSESVLGESDALDGEDVLPGFSCPLADLL